MRVMLTDELLQPGAQDGVGRDRSRAGLLTVLLRCITLLVRRRRIAAHRVVF